MASHEAIMLQGVHEEIYQFECAERAVHRAIRVAFAPGTKVMFMRGTMSKPCLATITGVCDTRLWIENSKTKKRYAISVHDIRKILPKDNAESESSHEH